MLPSSLLVDFKSREAAAAATAELAEASLARALQKRGKAGLVVSGGSTPGPAFKRLSKARLDWSNIHIGLVDERCVAPDHKASNEGLVRRTLLQNAAISASFLPMWTEDKAQAGAANTANTLYAEHTPFDFVLLGMGPDGHTASWFPGARNLDDALRASDKTIVSIDAKGCPVAGEHTDRLTLTLPAIAEAQRATLLIYGDDKRDVYETALTQPVKDCPVRAAIEALGERLTVIWAR